MRITIGKILIIIGILFILNAIFGRYLVLPDYLLYLEKGKDVITPSVWGIIKYIMWGYSFKLGVFFTLLGTFLLTSMMFRRFGLLTIGGIIYLLLAFAPIPGPYSMFFGIGGGVITILLLLIVYWWLANRTAMKGTAITFEDYRMIGYFFFTMATYNLCGLTGVSAFALKPEKMIQYGLEARAATYAAHVMIELVLGWLFICISHYKAQKRS